MKKIIMVAYDLNPQLGSECGVSSMLLEGVANNYFVEVFVAEKHKVDIDIKQYPYAHFNFITLNPTIQKLLEKMFAFHIANGLFLREVKKILASWDLRQYSLIHCVSPFGLHTYNDLYKFNLPVLIGPVGGGLPTPRGFENIFCDEFFKNILRDFYYRWVFTQIEWREYFLHSQKVIIGTDLVMNALPPEVRDRCLIIFDSVVDTAYFFPGSCAGGGRIKILFAGLLAAKKGVIMLVEAVRLCIERGCRDFVVEIAGDGPLRGKLSKLIDKYDLRDHVVLLGRLSKSDLLHKYQQSDIFCLPTLREPGGNVILEAMACGLPIVTSNYGGPKYIVTEDCGIKVNLVSSNQYINDLSVALEKLIINHSLRKSMGAYARDRVVKEFSLKVFHRKMADVYRILLS